MQFQTLTGRARWAIAALDVTVVTDIVSIVLDLHRYDLLGRVESGGDFTTAEVNASDDRQALIGLAQVLVLAVTAVLFIR